MRRKSKGMLSRPFQLVTFGSLFLLSLFLPAATVAQESPKTLEWEDHRNINSGKVDLPWSRRIDEIELEDILIDGRSVLISEPFVGDIRNLTFRVKNVSDGPVGFVQITVTLPEIKSSPQIPFVRSGDIKTQKPLLPGQEAELTIPDRKIYDWVADAVTHQGGELKSVKRAAIYVVLIVSPKSGQLLGGCLRTRDSRDDCRLRP
jgi:hypothetical protein